MDAIKLTTAVLVGGEHVPAGEILVVGLSVDYATAKNLVLRGRAEEMSMTEPATEQPLVAAAADAGKPPKTK